MLSLYINTAETESHLMIFRGETVIAEDHWPSEARLGDELLPHIEQLCRSAKATLSDISAFLVYPGPGSFTGTRVGVTVANALAWSLNKPVIGVDETTLAATLKSNVLSTSSFTASVAPVYSAPPAITPRP